MDDPDASITATQSINRFSDEPTEANRSPLVLALCKERVLWDTLGVGVSSYSSYWSCTRARWYCTGDRWRYGRTHAVVTTRAAQTTHTYKNEDLRAQAPNEEGRRAMLQGTA